MLSKFDEFGMELKHTTVQSHDDSDLFIEELAQSNQEKYIQPLDLYNILPRPMIKLSDMKSLKIFYINGNDSDDFPEYKSNKNLTLANLLKLVLIHFLRCLQLISTWILTNQYQT
jgi:hypothetical protein